jgi:hypothetical protein
MVHKSVFLSALSFFLFHISASAIEIELFSLSYDGEHLNLKALSEISIYDQKQAEKEVAAMKLHQEIIETNDSKSKNLDHDIKETEKRVAQKRKLLQEIARETLV